MPTYEDVFPLEFSVLLGKLKHIGERVFLVKKVMHRFLYHLQLVGRFLAARRTRTRFRSGHLCSRLSPALVIVDIRKGVYSAGIVVYGTQYGSYTLYCHKIISQLTTALQVLK